MNDYSSVQHVARILNIQSDDYDKLLNQSSAMPIVLLDGPDIWLKDEKNFPLSTDLIKENFDFHSQRQTAIKVNKTLFLTTNNTNIASLTKINFRAALENWSPETIKDVFLGAQILKWSEGNLFCAGCGETLSVHPATAAKICTRCDRTFYPQLNPVIIVLISRKTKEGRELLLAKGLSPKNYYSCIAGFVEPGEALEQAIHREVLEEVGVFIENIRYFGSQAWPFPSELMVGYIAEWKSGEINIDKNEISDAQWFTSSSLPLLPPQFAIARKMIDSLCP